jgi:hypothetical protein
MDWAKYKQVISVDAFTINLYNIASLDGSLLTFSYEIEVFKQLPRNGDAATLKVAARCQ